MYCLIKSFENICVGFHSDNCDSYDKESPFLYNLAVFKFFLLFFILSTYIFNTITLKLSIN
jgi:hypothetical protein